MDFEGNSRIQKIQSKTYVGQNSKITLGVERPRCQYRPTRPKPKAKIQGECFAPCQISRRVLRTMKEIPVFEILKQKLT